MNENPYATPGQRAVEDRALALLKRPELERARDVVTTLFKNVATWPDRDQMNRFDNMIDEYMFHHAFRAANCDPNFPEVARYMVQAHHWFGRDVPGSRWAGDCPDFIYRTIPVGHGGRYEIHGRPTCAKPPMVFYSLMADTTAAPVTQSLLESLDMEFDSDGSFTITVDETPANSRRNHLQTRPGAEFIMVRDALADWINQSPNQLTVSRLNHPDKDPRSESDMARHAALIAIQGVYYTYYCMQSGKGQKPNTVRPPLSSAVFGAVATQWGTKGHLDLTDDQALIIRSNAAGAQFRNLVLTDVFHMTIEYWKRTSSLNMEQMIADDDGDFTFVISHQDPGIHNWLDTGGLRRMNFGQRWQAFERRGKTSDPWMTTKLLKFDDLVKELPEGVRSIDTAGRKSQLAARKTGIAGRFKDD